MTREPTTRPTLNARESSGGLDVSAVVLSHNRADVIGEVLDRLQVLPVDEVIVADNASSDGTPELARAHPSGVQVLDMGSNAGIAARNRAARTARGKYLLMLDDDSYPLPGAVEGIVELLERNEDVAAVGGLVRELLADDRVLEEEVGTFDWFLRAGRRGAPPPDGFPAFFFPEGACVVRREAFLSVGGFFEPYFFGNEGLDLATRLIGAGWEVRYLPTARFDHLKLQQRSFGFEGVLRHRIRNHLWYLWLRFPATVAARRIPAYLVFDLVECAYRGAFSAWGGAIADALRERGRVSAERRPLTRSALRRAELNRGRLHMRLLAEMARKRLPPPFGAHGE